MDAYSSRGRLFTASCILVLSIAASGLSQSGAVPVERLIVRYEGGLFSLQGQMVVTKRIPMSDLLPLSPGPLSGFWYELQDAEGSVLYRRIIGNPLLASFEGPDLENGDQPVLVDAITDPATFVLLVPLLSSATKMVIFSSPLRPGAQGEPATEVAVLPLGSSIPVIK
jgi:hypothetical protein